VSARRRLNPPVAREGPQVVPVFVEEALGRLLKISVEPDAAAAASALRGPS